MSDHTNIADVRAALRAGTLHRVKGIGARRVQRICEALAKEGER